MQDEPQAEEQPKDKNQPPALRTISRKLTRRHKAFADRYLVNGMNATEAYRHTFKPKVAESAHANAYRVMALEGVKEYVERRLIELNDASYHPEAIKSALAERAVSSTRDSDKIRSLEIMAKIQGLLTDGQPTQVNVFTDDIMSLAKKRLSERKELSKSQNVILPESSEVIDTKEDIAPMSYNNCYVPSNSESVLSINKDIDAGLDDTTSSSDNGAGSDEDSPGIGGSSTPTQGPR